MSNQPSSPNDANLTTRDHMDPDKHWIGETLPAGSIKDMAPSSGSANSVGVSPFPARIDHTHNITASGLFVAKTGDVMSGSLWTKALSINNVNPLLELWNDAGTTRYAYFWGNAGTATVELAAENSYQLAFRVGGSIRETIDTTGNHWWVGGTNGDAMLFDRTNQILSIKATSSGEALRLSSSVSSPFIGFYNVSMTRMAYIQGLAGGFNFGLDTGTAFNFYVAGVSAAQISAQAIVTNGVVQSNKIPNSLTWVDANFRAYHTSTSPSDRSRLALIAGTAAPQIQVAHVNGERMSFINSSGTLYTPIDASAFTVASSIKIKKDVRSVKCKALNEYRKGKAESHPLLDTVPELDIMALRPIAYRHKFGPTEIKSTDPDKEIDPEDDKSWKAVPRDPKSHLGIEGLREKLGLIGEEVQTVLPSAVSIDENGDVIGIDYAQVTVALLSHVQQLTDEIVSLRERVAELEDA